jgi:hypothetical protein
MYSSRIEISCTSPQQEQLTLTLLDHNSPRVCTSVLMPLGARHPVFGQVKSSVVSMARSLSQGGTPPVSQPPTSSHRTSVGRELLEESSMRLIRWLRYAFDCLLLRLLVAAAGNISNGNDANQLLSVVQHR